jgi:hemoglobin
VAQTIYEKYGGFAGISRVVLDFYDKVLDSDEIGDYFDGVDMKRLVDHQTKFIAYVTGGPADFSDSRLQQVHAHLNISGDDFEEMKRLLAETLREHNYAEADVKTVIGAIEERRTAIVA